MKVSAWLVLELPSGIWSSSVAPKIVRVRQSRPTNEMAIHITLDFDENTFQPHVERMINSDLVQLEIVEPEVEAANDFAAL